MLGTAGSIPGQVTRGRVALAEFADGPFEAPCMVATGRGGDGPTLFLQAGIHGPEVIGQLSIARFLRGLDLGQLRGRIAALMVANPLGFRAQNRLTPQDGANLNRVFPGKPDGTASEQLAHRVLELSLAVGDALLDLHNGGDLTITAFYAIWAKGHGAASDEAQRLCASLGSRYQWGSDEAWLDGAHFSNFTRRGKPGLIVESGGGARVTQEDLDRMQTAITGICQALGMLPGDPPRADDIRYGGGAVHLKATRGGFWHPHVAPGDDVAQGQVLGEMRDVWGDVVEEVRCSVDRGWIGSIRRPYAALHNGDQVVELVERRDEP